MTDIIKALQDEIEAAAKKRSEYLHRFLNGEASSMDVRDNIVSADSRIQGLQTAVDLLTKEQARELPY